MSPTKTQCMPVSRSKAFPPHPDADLFINDVPLTLCDSFNILFVIFDNRFIFEHHSASSSVAQKISLLRNIFKTWESIILAEMF